MMKIPIITSYMKEQRLKWFGHIKRSEIINKASARHQKAKKLRGRPKKKKTKKLVK